MDDLNNYDYKIISDEIQESPTLRLPFQFKLKRLIFQIEQVTDRELHQFELTIYKIFSFYLRHDLTNDEIREDLSTVMIKDKYNIIQRWKLLRRFLSKIIRPVNRFNFYKMCIRNIKANLFNKRHWFISVYGMLKHVDINDMIDMTVRYYVYSSEVKKKVLSILQKGLGSQYLETMTGSQRKEYSGKSSSLGDLHDAILQELKSAHSLKTTDTSNLTRTMNMN